MAAARAAATETAIMAFAPETVLVGGPIQIDHGPVQIQLLPGLEAAYGLTDLGVDGLHGLEDALAQVSVRIPVAELDGFVLSSGRSTGNGGTPPSSGLQEHLGLNRGIAS